MSKFGYWSSGIGGGLVWKPKVPKMSTEEVNAVYSAAFIKAKEQRKGERVMGKYQRQCKDSVIDVYDVLQAFEVNNPAIAHAVKKLLAPGKRGVKDVIQDLEESISAILRAIELEKNK